MRAVSKAGDACRRSGSEPWPDTLGSNVPAQRAPRAWGGVSLLSAPYHQRRTLRRACRGFGERCRFRLNSQRRLKGQRRTAISTTMACPRVSARPSQGLGPSPSQTEKGKRQRKEEREASAATPTRAAAFPLDYEPGDHEFIDCDIGPGGVGGRHLDVVRTRRQCGREGVVRDRPRCADLAP
jgi:hypothetical protein